MATVRTESEQPLDKELVNGVFPGDEAEQQNASDTAVDRCVEGRSVKETTDVDVPPSPTDENAPPHGASSALNKDASEMSCDSTATVDERRMNEDFNKGEVASDEPGEDGGVTSGNLHNENRGKHNFASRADSKRVWISQCCTRMINAANTETMQQLLLRNWPVLAQSETQLSV